MNQPLVSVLILTYNHENYIEECLNSFYNDGYENLEIIVCDNGSTDKTPQIIQMFSEQNGKYNTKLLLNKKGTSINIAMNQLLKESSGEWILIISGDDLSVKGRIKKQLTIFNNNSHLRALYGNYKCFKDENSERVFSDPIYDQAKQMREKLEIGLPKLLYFHSDQFPFYQVGSGFIQALMIKRELVLEMKGFDEECIADDLVFNIRLFKTLKNIDEIAVDDEIVFYYRQHENQIHRDFIRQSGSVVQAFKKYVPEEIKDIVLAKTYSFHSKIAFNTYGFKYLGSGFKYLLLSQKHYFNLQSLIQDFVVMLFGIVKSISFFQRLYNTNIIKQFISLYKLKIWKT
jgi:glycosyltransferase involved in cell wall biosynthesis